ncbi:MAG: hypothetical protein HIU89_10455 [Proteobacteria bacterium]|nr:hypothetical protein [Pseudomonadota bacterium]
MIQADPQAAPANPATHQHGVSEAQAAKERTDTGLGQDGRIIILSQRRGNGLSGCIR